MQAPELLKLLQEHGAVVTLDGASIVVQPARVLDDDLRAELRRLKPELLVLLTAPTFASAAAGVEKQSKQTPPTPNTPTPLSAERPRHESESSTRTALELFRAEVQALQVEWCSGLLRVTSQLIEMWKAAEIETGQALTISGTPRRKPKRAPIVFSDTSLDSMHTNKQNTVGRQRGEP